MGLSPDANASLHALSAMAGTDRQLASGLRQLLEHACVAVPSCLGISLTIVRELLPVSLVAIVPAVADRRVLSSLAVRLPVHGSEPGASRALTLYAYAAGAFVSLAPDLKRLLDLDPSRVMVDGHLDLPIADLAGDGLTGQLDDLAVMDKALGVLLDRGLQGSAGRGELERLAAQHGVDVAAAALLILDKVRRPPTGDQSGAAG